MKTLKERIENEQIFKYLIENKYKEIFSERVYLEKKKMALLAYKEQLKQDTKKK